MLSVGEKQWISRCRFLLLNSVVAAPLGEQGGGVGGQVLHPDSLVEKLFCRVFEVKRSLENLLPKGRRPEEGWMGSASMLSALLVRRLL